MNGLVNAGAKSERTKQISNTLNLAACDIVKHSKILGDDLDTTFEISKLVKFSPKHDSRF